MDEPQDIESVEISDVDPRVPIPEARRLFTRKPPRRREDVRAIIAYWLLGTLIAIIFGDYLALVAGAVSLEGFKTVVTDLFTPVLGVFGAVTGFYFGEHNKEKKR